MKSYKAHLRSVLAAAPQPRVERVAAHEALGRVLQADVVARVHDPAEARSAMDGYAVRRADLRHAGADNPRFLPADGVLPAGRDRSRSLPAGCVRRIMTGAPLPPGADAVVPVEQVSVQSGVVTFMALPPSGAHVRRPAENFRKGDVLIGAGTVVRPQEIGLCITGGVPVLKVARRYRVGVLSTGTELVAPGGRLRRGEVFDSNRPMVLAQVQETGADAIDLGVISDTTRGLGAKLSQVRKKVDLLVTIGGISAGDFDIVKLFLRSYPSVDQVRVAMRPAKPQAFGRIGSLYWYALPGNPVSAMVAFDRFVRPLILRAMGQRLVFRQVRTGVCAKSRVKPPRLREFVRAVARRRSGGWQVNPVGPEGSSNLRSMVHANAFLILPERTSGIKAGQAVLFELFSDPPTCETPP